MSKMVLGGVAVGTAVVLLAGCAARSPSETREPTSQPTVTREESEPSPVPTESASEARRDDAIEGFLLNVRHVPSLAEQTDDQLLDAGARVCSDLDQGGSYDDAVAPLLASGLSADDALVLASTAVFEFCHEHDLVMEGAVVGVDPDELAVEPEDAARAAFLAQVREDGYYGPELSDDMLLMLGTTMCDGFTRGDTLEVTLGYMGEIPQSSAMAFLRAATQHICPEHADKV